MISDPGTQQGNRTGRNRPDDGIMRADVGRTSGLDVSAHHAGRSRRLCAACNYAGGDALFRRARIARVKRGRAGWESSKKINDESEAVWEATHVALPMGHLQLPRPTAFLQRRARAV
jgi:hypothetical protein